MATLVFLESHGTELQKGSLGVLAKAASLGDAAAVIAGEAARGLAAEAGTYGAAKVWVCEDAEVAQPLPQPRVDVLAQVVEEGGYDTVLFCELRPRRRRRSRSRGASRRRAQLGPRRSRAAGTATSSASVRRFRTPSSRTSAGRARRGSRSSAPARSTRPRPAAASPEIADVSPTYAEHSTGREARLPGRRGVERARRSRTPT